MPFRLVKFWSSVSLWVAALLFAVPDASATVTLQPSRLDGTLLQNVKTNIAYYPAGVTESASLFLDVNDSTMPPAILDLSKYQSDLSSTRNNMLVLMVESDKSLTTPTVPQYLVITLYAAGSSGTKAVPIAFAQDSNFSTTGGTACSVGLPCQGADTAVLDPSGNSYYLALRYTSLSRTQIGFYPADICYFYSAKYGGTANGCTGTTPLTAGGASTMQLTVNIEIATSEIAAGDPTKVQDSTSAALSTIFQMTGPTMTASSCPSSGEFYFPGDGQIYIDSNQFSASVASGTAPIAKLIVVGNDAGSAVRDATYSSSNPVYGRVDVNNGTQTISGFTNTTNGADHKYELGYMIRDYAGMVGVATAGCTTSNVQTASIQGFLKKGSCFIATAAYRDPDAAPVRMLRQFRDEVLLKREWGSAFVRWYYDWSPGAAEWLMENPVFRYPVLVLLAPVELLAWCALHPDSAALVAFALAGIAALIRLRRRQGQERNV